MFTLIEDADSYDDYGFGCIDQHSFCEYEARVLAFGAIRRAVAIARDTENVGLRWTAFGVMKDPESVERANEIRYVIRAAIGSEKV